MKKFLVFALTSIILTSCSKNDKIKSEAEDIPVSIEVDRYDKAFFETKPQDLNKLKSKYPFFFPPNVSDTAMVEKMTNPLWRELYKEVEKRYDNFDLEKEGIEDLFKYIKFYYPKTRTPKVVTLIHDMDPQYKAIYADSLVVISLEMYLGKNHKFYEYPEYVKKTFEPSQILPDIVQSFSYGKVKPPMERDFLSQLVYAGKQLYLKDILLPEYSDEDKICYTTDEIKWCEEHDVDVWRFFVEEKLLYSTDSKLIPKFIEPAPFSKFGLTNDNETPGRVGAWIGWQIVRAFMDNNDVPPQQMFLMDAKEIFQKSKYKPTK